MKVSRRYTCSPKWLILLMGFFFSSLASYSQVVTIGGIGSPGVWEISPFYIFNASRIRTQYLYRASDLITAGATAGVIDSIAFYRTPSSTFNSVGGTARGTIHSTTATSLSNSSSGGFEPLNGTGSSFTAFNLTISSGWNKQSLNLPFVWNGTDNLLFNICTRPSSTNPSSGPAVNASFTSYGSCISGIDAANVSCSNVTATNAYLGRPVIRLYFSNRPSLTVTTTTNAGLCGYDGSIMATASGGYPPYSFLWSTSSTSNQLAGLNSGNYTVTVSDALNQTTSSTAALVTPPTINVAVSRIQQLKCFGINDGEIDLNVSNGTPPFSYLWSDNSIDSNRTNLGAGNYSVTVTDSNSCISTLNTIIISQPIPLTINFSRTLESCPNAADGSLSASISGGNSPYTYQWSNQSNSTAISNLTAGSYSLTVTDAQNCILIDSIVLINPDTINRNVIVSGNLLISSQSSVNYQWLNCRNNFSPIPNANTQFFSPPPNGVYAVELTKGSCIDTSYCTPYLVTNLENKAANQIQVSNYNGIVKISASTYLNDALFVYNAHGKLIHIQQLIGQNIEIDLNSSGAGIYILKASRFTHKLIIR